MVRVQIGSEFPVIDESMRNVDMVSTQDGIGAPRGLTVALSNGGDHQILHVPYGISVGSVGSGGIENS